MASVKVPKLPSSIWLTNAGVKVPKGPERTFPTINNVKNKHFDAVIVGGGIFGVSTAYTLKKAGMRVALLEGRTIGTGTTGFSTAKLSAQQGPLMSMITEKRGKKAARDYYDINMNGIRIAEQLTNELGLKCEMEKRPHMTWSGSPNSVSTVEKEIKASQELGIPHRVLESADLLKELPATLSPQLAIAYDDMIQFNSFEYCRELAKHIEGDGSVVYEDSRVTSVSENLLSSLSNTKKNHDIQLEENDSLLTSDYVVQATHLPISDISLLFSILEPSRSHCIAVRVKKGSSPMRIMSVNTDQPMRSMRTDKDNDVIIISGEMVVMGDQSVNTDEKYQTLEAWARQHFQVEEIVCRWSAMDYSCADHVPYLGYLHPGTKTAFTASGFSKWGLAFSIGGAEIINDLIHGRSNSLFDTVNAQRTDIINQAQSLLQENSHTASHMIGDKIKQAFTFTSIKSLKNGEGGVCKSGLKTVGAYRDEDGVVHAVEPVCTHLGCNVVFNHGDKMWDCPCHGSQFGVDGEVIHGPAVKPLCKVTDIDW